MTYLEQRQAHILAGRPIAKKEKKPIAKISPKRQAKLNEQAKAGDNKLDDWFEARRLEMKGVCAHCGGKSCKDSDDFYRFSIAHILQKAYFPSVSTHPLNWIELCFWNLSCHTNWDNCTLSTSDLNCFSTVIERFQILYPLLTKEEKSRLPEIFKNYIEVNE